MSHHEVDFVRSVTKLDDFPPERLPEVAFLGASNVGKSSLLNALLGKRGVARTSKTPGRTQALNFFRVDGRLHFVDLPGYGYARVPRDVQQGFLRLVEGYLAGSPRLALLALLLDCRRLPSQRDLELRDWLAKSSVPHVLVLTKVDKLSRSQLGLQEREIRAALGAPSTAASLVRFSAVTGDGRRELWREIESAVAAPRAARPASASS